MKTGSSNPGFNKFSYEGGGSNQRKPGLKNSLQYSLTQTGLSRINQSIKAFVYCILRAQVHVRNSILGEGGKAKEAQSEYLVLMADSINQPDSVQSVQRYQLGVDQA